MSDSALISSNLPDQLLEQSQLENIVYTSASGRREAQFVPFPPELHPALRNALESSGIHAMFSHQYQAWQNTRARQHQVIVAGTAGGKSLAYHFPVLHDLLVDPQATALYLFPTKALTQDQLAHLDDLLQGINAEVPEQIQIHAGIYDGDTPVHHRRAIRENARILLTNPDMLHTGVLPRHPQWTAFFSHLRYIVLDEIHAYRGVFGSHVANVLRRLNRICTYYGSQPLYILTSATIANPQEHASALTCHPVVLVSQDGSARSARTFCIYNPPLSNPELGIRKSAIFESVHLLYTLLQHNIQTIAFGRARKTVELVLNYFLQLHPEFSGSISAYRGGYLPHDRRVIEKRLREGDLRAVIATNALELGIDIGNMDAALLIGYPGSLASTLQQIGRAGRQSREALAILLATSDPMDQYLAHHPDYFLGLTPERALIDPDHLVILLNHLQCAAYELPFTDPPAYGNLPADLVQQFLQILENEGYLQWRSGKLYWTTASYPASGISLRTASAEQVVLKLYGAQDVITLGTVDKLSSYWMVHPEAIYMQDGVTYAVKNLDLEKNTADLVEVQEDFYTEPQKVVEIQVLKVQELKDQPADTLGFGELNVQTKVKGYKRIQYFTHEQLGTTELNMPTVSFPTVGCWISLKDESVQALRDQGLWLNDTNKYGPDWPVIREIVRQRDRYRCRNCGAPEHGKAHHVHHLIPFKSFRSIEEANQISNLVTLCPTCHRIAEVNLHLQSGLAGISFALRHLAPLFVLCDISDLEVHADSQSAANGGAPTVTVFDNISGGIGLSRVVYDQFPSILQAVRELISQCACESGCPSCIGPAGENGYGGKREALAILDMLLENSNG